MEQKKDFKYPSLYKKHLDFSATKPIIAYDFDELINFFGDCVKMFKAEKTLIEIPLPVTVISDIHGQYEDLHRILTAIRTYKNYEKSRVVFLGNLVDRGIASLQCYVAVLVRKLAFPDKFHVTRGNHECRKINMKIGQKGKFFWDELKDRFPIEEARKLLDAIDKVYQWTPLAALVGKKVLCVPGGIGPSIKSLDDIRYIPRPIQSTKAPSIVGQLLWSDPNPNRKIKGFLYNDKRHTSIYYGEDEIDRAIKELHIANIVRGHECTPNGYTYPFLTGKLVSLFSAPGYMKDANGKLNDGAVATIDENFKFKFRRVTVVPNAFGANPDLPSIDDVTNADSVIEEETTEGKSAAGTKKNNSDMPMTTTSTDEDGNARKNKLNANQLERPGTATELIEY